MYIKQEKHESLDFFTCIDKILKEETDSLQSKIMRNCEKNYEKTKGYSCIKEFSSHISARENGLKIKCSKTMRK